MLVAVSVSVRRLLWLLAAYRRQVHDVLRCSCLDNEEARNYTALLTAVLLRLVIGPGAAFRIYVSLFSPLAWGPSGVYVVRRIL